ncbi:sulfatase family protein [Maribellus maritimus]|uniref:sulfatase family protein n=1 Tax=Maribellus maritimus TaxID=2870838 RepID=UPI001EEB3B81|nr:sulfatase [Maribellus maritimus]MCG6188616.1 sulfatase [Maribellus maritimus]
MKLNIAFLIILLGLTSGKEEKPQARPNILFCIADDASFPYMGAYGCSWVKTPAFDKVASSGVLFTNAYTPNAKCAPSRACILTGRNSWQLEEAGNHVGNFPKKFTSYVEELKDHGYFVGYTGKSWEPGNPGTINGKRRELTGRAYNQVKKEKPTRWISATDYSTNFDHFLNDVPDGRPWCFWYGGREPHRRYEFGSGIKKGGKTLDMIDEVPGFWPDNDTVRTDMLDYAFEVEYFDSQLLQILNKLEETGQLENTVVVVTSDNGMPFPRCKAQEYEMSNHMPFAIMWPDGIKNPGRVSDEYVSFIDISPTFLEVAGVSESERGMQKITGRSLLPILKDNKLSQGGENFVLIGRERHDFGRPNNQGYPIRGIIEDEMLYLYNFKTELWPAGNPETGYLDCDGSPTKTFILNERRENGQSKYWQLAFGKRQQEELYNLKEDPYCLDNLCNVVDFEQVKEKLKNKLFEQLKNQEDPRMFGNGDVFDNYPFQSDKFWNFYEKYMNGDRSVNTGWVNVTDFEIK